MNSIITILIFKALYANPYNGVVVNLKENIKIDYVATIYANKSEKHILVSYRQDRLYCSVDRKYLYKETPEGVNDFVFNIVNFTNFFKCRKKE